MGDTSGGREPVEHIEDMEAQLKAIRDGWSEARWRDQPGYPEGWRPPGADKTAAMWRQGRAAGDNADNR